MYFFELKVFFGCFPSRNISDIKDVSRVVNSSVMKLVGEEDDVDITKPGMSERYYNVYYSNSVTAYHSNRGLFCDLCNI